MLKDIRNNERIIYDDPPKAEQLFPIIKSRTYMQALYFLQKHRHAC